jgi:hypothetical protein
VLSGDALRRADPGRLAGAGSAWRRLAEALATGTAELDRQLLALGSGWTGPASTAATGLVGGLCAELDAAYPSLRGIEQALTGHADAVRRAQLFVDTAPDAALALARSSDMATAARLRALHPAPSATGAPGTGTPPPDADPGAVACWWQALSPAQRRWLLEERPDSIGNLDGIPADARDLANRARLARLLADPAVRHRSALLGIQARLTAGGAARPYLLGLSTEGTGRAILAIGDPDTAAHVVTYVPGLGANLDHGLDEIARADRLADAARQAAPGRSTSVIAWLGYDAPGSLPAAARVDPAVRAAPGLHRFQAGLRATHLGGVSHNTVVGLSYGSTVVGLTGHGPGLLADDVVLIGSPGVGVAHAADLGLGPGHVWASTARHDVINAAADPRDLLRPDLNPLLRPLVGEHTDRLWFGPSPTGHAFGAHVFTSAPGSGLDPVHAHLGYFDGGNPALADMADIAVGDYAEVR